MKINEIITENDELNEIWPAVALRVGTALAPKIKTAWNAIKGVGKSTTKSNKAAGEKAAELYGPTRTFPGGVARHHLAKGPNKLTTTKLPPNAKSMTGTKTKTKPTKKTDTKVDARDKQMNYHGGGRYTDKRFKK